MFRMHPFEFAAPITRSFRSQTYELLVGYSPFSEGPNPAPKDFIQRAVDLGMNILTRDVSTLYFPASISMEVREFIQSCLTVSPLERPTADGTCRAALHSIFCSRYFFLISKPVF